MCKYCNVEAEQEGIRFDKDANSGEGIYLDWVPSSKGIKWCINCENSDWYVSYAPIGYCPKCGRLLKEENKSNLKGNLKSGPIFNYEIVMNNGNKYNVKTEENIKEFMERLYGDSSSVVMTSLQIYKEEWEDDLLHVKDELVNTKKSVVVLSTSISEVIYDSCEQGM